MGAILCVCGTVRGGVVIFYDVVHIILHIVLALNFKFFVCMWDFFFFGGGVLFF